MRFESYLKVINTFEVLHFPPHHPNLVGQQLALVVEDIDYNRLLNKPEIKINLVRSNEPFVLKAI